MSIELESIAVETVAEVAESLEAAARPVYEGGLAWLQPYEGRMVPIGTDFYVGTSGIALFFSAWSRCGGGQSARSLAFQSLTPIRRRAQRLRSQTVSLETARLGIGVGIPSLVYAMTLAADLLEAPELLAEAKDLFAAIPPIAFEAATHLDVMTGSAGAILAGLALDEIAQQQGTDSGPALDHAVRAGERIRAGAEPLNFTGSRDGHPSDIACLGWPPVPGARAVSGFAHGAAGIVFALSRLAARTGLDWNDSIRGGLAMERATFSPANANWRDLRVDHERYMTMWCHGAPGIALGRLGMLGYFEDPELEHEIEAGLIVARDTPTRGVDHLCCGNLGRADILARASQCLGRADLWARSIAIALEVVERHKKGVVNLGFGDEPEISFSLFLGQAGLGYTLLRLAFPENLPAASSFLARPEESL